jgi:hypothetical protein
MKESEFNQIIMTLGQKCEGVEAKLDNYVTIEQGKALEKRIKGQGSVINGVIDLVHKLEERTNTLENKISSLKTTESTSDADELDKLKKQVSLLSKNINPEVVSYKTFSPKEITELKKTMSWPKLAAYLKCSVSTCQRLVKKGRTQQ